jgi:CHASE3 domain sensor protein
MKKIINWFRYIDLQGRLFFIFTVIFVIGVLSLGIFLQMTANLIHYNSNLRDVFAKTQKTYRLQTLLQKMKLAQNTYELDADTYAQVDFNSYNSLLDDYIQDLLDDEARIQDENTPDVVNSLEQLQQDKQQYLSLFDQIVDARDAEDYTAVQQLDEQASQVSSQMTEAVESLHQLWMDTLDGVEQDVDWFSLIAWVTIICTLPIFLLVIVIAAVLIHYQANRPMNLLIQATADVEAGKFDPARLRNLANRKDEVGAMAGEFIHMAETTTVRRENLQRQADEIRGKIRQ